MDSIMKYDKVGGVRSVQKSGDGHWGSWCGKAGNTTMAVWRTRIERFLFAGENSAEAIEVRLPTLTEKHIPFNLEIGNWWWNWWCRSRWRMRATFCWHKLASITFSVTWWNCQSLNPRKAKKSSVKEMFALTFWTEYLDSLLTFSSSVGLCRCRLDN